MFSSVILRYAKNEKEFTTVATIKKFGRYMFGDRQKDTWKKSPHKMHLCTHIHICVRLYVRSKMPAVGGRVILSHDGPCPNDGQVLGNYASLNCWLLKGCGGPPLITHADHLYRSFAFER